MFVMVSARARFDLLGLDSSQDHPGNDRVFAMADRSGVGALRATRAAAGVSIGPFEELPP